MSDATLSISSPKRSHLAIALCVVVACFEGFDLQAPSVSAAQIVLAFDLSPTQLGTFFSAGTLGLLFGALGGGVLSDRYGRKPMLIISTIWFGLGALANGLTTSFDMLLLSRFVTGIGMGATLPNLIAIASEAATPERRGRAVALVIAAMPVGGAAASLLAGTDLVLRDWRVLYFYAAGAPLLFAPVLLLLPHAKPVVREAPVQKIELAELFDTGHRRSTLMLWTASMLLMVSVYLISSWLPTLLRDRGLSHADTLDVQLLFNVSGIAGGILSGWLLDRPSIQRSIGITLLYICYPVSIFVLAVAPANLLTISLLGALVGTMVTAVCTILYGLASALYPAHVRGSGVGFSVAAGRLGSILGPLLPGALLGLGYSGASVLIAMIPFIAIAAVCAILIGRAADRAARLQN